MPPTPVQPHRNEAAVAWNRVGEIVPPFVLTLCRIRHSDALFLICWEILFAPPISI